MKKHFSVIVILFLAIIILQRLPATSFSRIPHSKPTPTEIFMQRIANIESGGNHRIVNDIGMLGKYQFSLRTIHNLGFDVTREQFLNNPDIQDSVMMANIRFNSRELQLYIERYDGKTIKGVKINRAAILAGAHFAGVNGVKAFLTNNNDYGITDIYGTSLRMYMQQFSRFSLPS